jgi:hypothetical protein
LGEPRRSQTSPETIRKTMRLWEQEPNRGLEVPKIAMVTHEGEDVHRAKRPYQIDIRSP